MLNLAISTTKVLFFLHSTKYLGDKTLKNTFSPPRISKSTAFYRYTQVFMLLRNFLMEENANNPTFQIFEHELHELHEFLFLNTD